MDHGNRPQLHLVPFVIRLSTSYTYPTKNRKFRKNAIHEGGMSRLFLPLNRASSLLEGPFFGLLRKVGAVSGAKKVETSHLRE